MFEIKNIDPLSSSESHDQINNLIEGDRSDSADLKRGDDVITPSRNHISKPNIKNEVPERTAVVVAPKNDDWITLRNRVKKNDRIKLENSPSKETNKIKKTWLRRTLDMILFPYKSIKGILRWIGNRIHSLRYHLNEPNIKIIEEQTEEKTISKKMEALNFDEFKEELNLDKSSLSEEDEAQRPELIGHGGEEIIAAMRSRKKYASPQNSMLSRLSRPDGEMKEMGKDASATTQKINAKDYNLHTDGSFSGFNRKSKPINENHTLIKKPLSEEIPDQNTIDQVKLLNLLNQGKGLVKSTFGEDGYLTRCAKKCSNMFDRFKGNDNDEQRKEKHQEEKDLKDGLNEIQHLDQLHLTIEEPLINIHDESNQFSMNIKLPTCKELRMNQYDDFLSILAKRYQFRLIEENGATESHSDSIYRKDISLYAKDGSHTQSTINEGLLEHPSGTGSGDSDSVPKEIIIKDLEQEISSTTLQSNTFEDRNPTKPSKAVIKFLYPNFSMMMWKKHQKMREFGPLNAFVALKKDLLVPRYHWLINHFDGKKSGQPLYKLRHLKDKKISQTQDLEMKIEQELVKSAGISERFVKSSKPSSNQTPQSGNPEFFSSTIDPMQHLLGKLGEILKARISKIKEMRVDLALDKAKGNVKKLLTNLFRSKKNWFKGKYAGSDGIRNHYGREKFGQTKTRISNNEGDVKTHKTIVPHINQQENSNKMDIIKSQKEVFDWADSLKFQREARAGVGLNKLISPLFTIFRDKTTWFSSEMNVWRLKVLKNFLHPQVEKMTEEPKFLLTLPAPHVKQPKLIKLTKVHHDHKMNKVRVSRVLNFIKSSKDKKTAEQKVENEEPKVQEVTGNMVSDVEEKENKNQKKDENENKRKAWRVSHYLSAKIKERVEFFEKLQGN